MFCRYFVFSSLSLATLTGCSETGFSDDAPIVSSKKITNNQIASSTKKLETFCDKNPESQLQSLVSTWEGVVLLTGWFDAKNKGYDVSTLSKEEKEDAIKKGLLILEGDTELKKVSYTILAHYFLYKKDLKKGMYWAFKGAENGSEKCMLLLSGAYLSGEGLVQDCAEGIKWTYLSAAAGEEKCKQWIKEFGGASGMANPHLAPLLIEGKKRAIEWMNKHPELFISAD